VDEGVAICSLKRFAADTDMNSLEPYRPKVAPPNGKKVAVIGAGPAGLSAAYFLVQRGYGVTVFESLPVAGGMLAVGIPEYRLPKDVLKAEIAAITDLGVEIKLNTALGRDITTEQLFSQGYGAVLIATGAHAGQKLGTPARTWKGSPRA
jgi:NADH-quinone oxidoreductase subunit F